MKTLSIPSLCALAIVAGGAFAQVPASTTVVPPASPVVIPTMPATRVPTPPATALPVVPPKADPKSTGAQAVDDSTITSKVNEAISSDSDLKSMSFTVETTDAVVTLHGVADSKEQVARALALVRAVAGVKSVINIVAVKTS